MPKISVITVVLNDKEGLEKTLQSCLSQDYNGGIEFIVIDGGSTDGCVEYLQAHSDKLSFWCSEPDDGIFSAMNKGVAHAHGEFCIFINAGDRFASSDVISHIFNNPTDEIKNADIIAGATFFERKTGKGAIRSFAYAPKNISFAFFFCLEKCLNHQSTFIRRKWLLKYPYDETLKIVGDVKFCLQSLIFDSARYVATPVPVAIFDEASVLSRAEGAESQELKKVYREFNIQRILSDYEFIMNKDNSASLRRKLLRTFFKRMFRRWTKK